MNRYMIPRPPHKSNNNTNTNGRSYGCGSHNFESYGNGRGGCGHGI